MDPNGIVTLIAHEEFDFARLRKMGAGAFCAVAQGSAPSGGTAFPIASTVSVPADASLIVVDKTTGLYLEEGVSLTITSGTASKLTFSVSYEIMA